MQNSNPSPGELRPAATEPPVALRTALVTAIARRRRNVRRRVAGAGLAAGAAALALGIGLSSTGPSQALAIDTDGGKWLEIHIVNADGAEAAEMTEQLHEAGIDVEVRLLPAPDGLAGNWMGIQQVDPPPPTAPAPSSPDAPIPAPAPLLAPNESRSTSTMLAIRRDAVYKLSEVRWIFYVGREPGAGEQPQMLFPGGPRPVDEDGQPLPDAGT